MLSIGCGDGVSLGGSELSDVSILSACTGIFVAAASLTTSFVRLLLLSFHTG